VLQSGSTNDIIFPIMLLRLLFGSSYVFLPHSLATQLLISYILFTALKGSLEWS
jgi:hypothetical protein